VDDLIEETRERFGVTSVVISHDMTSALKIANYVFLIAKGKLVGEGPPSELVEGKIRLAHEFLDASGIAAERLLAERHDEAAKRPNRDDGKKR
jgi:phospholipid/cholesterol/gamma-HCH transport system ATP-binding protein